MSGLLPKARDMELVSTVEALRKLERLRSEDLTRFGTEELRELLETLRWWKNLKRISNEHFRPLFFDAHRYLVLKGGGGSGKSVFAAQNIVNRVTGEPGHRWLVVRKVARTLRQSCWANLLERLEKDFPECGYRVNRTDMVISFPNGSEILFAGADDVEKLKSIQSITGIWIEEASELERGDFNQLDIRLRTNFPFHLQMILSFNPISVSHWLKERFFDQRDQRAMVDESTWKDNRFLPEENVRTMEGFRDTDPYYYQVYFLGQWGVTGRTVFDAAAISKRLEELAGGTAVGQSAMTSPCADKARVPARGLFLYDYDGVKITNIRWEDDPNGPVVIFHPPEKGRPYVAGGDTAGEGSDRFTGQVLDNISGRQAARLMHQYDEDVYARQMYCLGMYYNQALIGIETNFSTFPVKELQRLGYHRQFVREREDTYAGGLKRAYGFRTDGLTRPVILSGLIQALRGRYSLIEDKDTLEELLTFVRDPKTLRPQAEPGAHDDLVMALAIAFYIRPQQSMTGPEPERKRVKWTRDMWEDYNGTDEAGRQYLVAKWGEPER